MKPGCKKEKLKPNEWALWTAVYVLIAAVAAWLFYDSAFLMLLFAPFFPLFIKAVKYSKSRRNTVKLTDEFLKALISVATSLGAGISPENAFVAAAADMEKLYGKKSQIVKELSVINSQVAMGRRLGDAIDDFAKRVRIQEIYDFSVVFSVAKEKGADFSAVISSCVEIMETTRQAESEARVIIRAKQYEQRVMCIIPYGDTC